ncbi:MAG: TadE/TadG family type IV pilus assembly protein [Anaerolineales bacterium]
MDQRKPIGQGVVEFALVIPILLLIVFGTFELARAVWIYSAISTAVREAARYGSTIGESEDGPPHYIDCEGMRALAKDFGAPGNVQDEDVLISYDRGPGTATIGECPVSQASIQLGDRIIVEVTGRFVPIPYLPLVQIPPITFTSEVHRTIVKALILDSIPITSTP